MTKLNLDKILIWNDIDNSLAQFHELVELAPMRSVVIEIHPPIAERLLQIANEHNRKFGRINLSRLARACGGNSFEITGDSLKFSDDGKLLDGQHRLQACCQTKTPFQTHVIFGLPQAISRYLDEGKKRTPADVLTLNGFENAAILAGAVRWVKAFETHTYTRHLDMTNAEVLELVQGKYAAIADHLTAGRQIWVAFGHPPSLITAVSYAISRHDKRLAYDFIHEWVHGARIDRNIGFDKLSQRLISVKRENGGIVNAYIRAALVIQTFNHWRAGVVPSLRSLTWNTSLSFPKLIFEGKISTADRGVAAETVAKVAALTKAGKTRDEVAEILDISKMTVYRALREDRMSAA